MPPAKRTPARAFTLIELLGVCALLGLLLAVISPTIGRQILQSRVTAEGANLQAMAAAARSSFTSSDLAGTNLAALAGAIPNGIASTNFSSTTNLAAIPATTNASDWFAKLARQQGNTPLVGVPPTPAMQPQVAAVLINPNGNTRLMLLGPNTESTQQRFLLISLMAPAGQLALPPWPNAANPQDPADLALFNDIWNTNWASPAAVLPSTWTAALTAAQIQAWQGPGQGGSRLWLLCVERLVCPKYTLTINNTHATDSCYVYYNLNGTTAGSVATIAANSGAVVVSGIYFGRLIQAYRGTAGPPAAQLFAQFTLRDSAEITVQD